MIAAIVHRLRIVSLAGIAWAGLAVTAQAMSFSVHPARDGLLVAFGIGPIETGSAPNLSRTLAAAGDGRVMLVLSSPGGNMMEAMRMGRILREARAWTHVSADPALMGCYSACFLAFAGGSRRSVAEGGELGVHQFQSMAPAPDALLAESEAQSMSGTILDYLETMGLDLYAALPMLRVRHDAMHVFSALELEGLGIVTPDCPFEFPMLDPLGLYPHC